MTKGQKGKYVARLPCNGLTMPIIIPKITVWHTVDTAHVVLNNLYVRYMSKQKIFLIYKYIYILTEVIFLFFQGKAVTLQDARKRDRTITMSNVSEFFKNNVEVKKNPRGYNSFVAPHNDHTHQTGICFPRMI